MNLSRPRIRLGTRGSQLAMTQSQWVQAQLEARGVSVELVMIRTEGDVSAQSLAQIGGQGVFTKRLQTALLEREIDLAVHSLKDLPTKAEDGLQIVAVPLREDRADALVSAGVGFNQLAPGAKVGTGSLRRAAQLRRLRPDLLVQDIRGNVDSRLQKLDQGQYDAIVLAAAGLNRLGWQQRITESFAPELVFPAVGQGALGLEVRDDDFPTQAWILPLNHEPSYRSAMAERAMLRALQAGCLSAVGANCTMSSDERLQLSGIVLSPDGQQMVQASHEAAGDQFETLGSVVANSLLAEGARELLEMK